MSWQTFKNNILDLSNNPDSINDIDLVAKTYATEYDAAIKRGKDSLHQISLQKGNVEAMTQLFKAALLKGQTSTSPYDLVGEMGKGVIAYWSGATMNNFPIPVIPATGATSNVSVTSNLVVNPGQWAPPVSSPAAARFNDPEELLDDAAQENNVENGQAEEFFADEPLTDAEVTEAAEEVESYPEGTEELPKEEVPLIEEPEEISYDETETEINIEEETSKKPNQPEEKNKVEADVSGAKTATNIGKSGVPPGWEKYVVDRSKIIRKGAKKHDGNGGGVPDSAMGRVNAGSYGSGNLHPEAAVFFSKFIAQAKSDKVVFTVSSWYRSYEGQVKCWNELEAGKAAVPGWSNHGFGVAVDIRELYRAVGGSIKADVNAEVRKNNKLYKYFAATAPKFGFYNPTTLSDNNKPDEVWHWEYHGFKTFTKDYRAKMMKS
jgi:LAS superfamily LD-carboxypeptidase LdcB